MSFFGEQHKATHLFLPYIHRKELPGPKVHRQHTCIAFVCKGKCGHVENIVQQFKNINGKGFDLDTRYCSGCDKYMKGGTTRCKCCGCLKRTRRISTKYRNRFKMGTPKLNCGAKIS